MYKVIYLFLLLSLVAGCSTMKVGKQTSNIDLKPYNTDITGNNFDIQKVEITDNGTKETYLANVKYRVPNKYLFSIRTKMGIEALRIYSVKDSVFVYDRIHNTVYVASDKIVYNRFGISLNMLPVLFGDIIMNTGTRIPDCANQKPVYKIVKNSGSFEYNIDCSSFKPVKLSFSNNNIRSFSVSYDEYNSINNIFVPANITFTSYMNEYDFNIKYNNYNFDTSGDIVFNIPKNAEIIILNK